MAKSPKACLRSESACDRLHGRRALVPLGCARPVSCSFRSFRIYHSECSLRRWFCQEEQRYQDGGSYRVASIYSPVDPASPSSGAAIRRRRAKHYTSPSPTHSENQRARGIYITLIQTVSQYKRVAPTYFTKNSPRIGSASVCETR